MVDDPEEFEAGGRFPNSTIPPSRWYERFACWWLGDHRWRKFLWGGLEHPFDCDCCTRCRRMRGPLPIDRDTEVFPCQLN
jgi:hypothetical protein